MAGTLYDFSTTPADNDDANLAAGVDWRELEAPGQVNDSERAFLSMFRAWLTTALGATATTGSANAYVYTSPGIFTHTGYEADMRISFLASFSNSGAATLNVDGLGAKSITKNGTTALVTGDIVSGRHYEVVYDGTQFQLVGVSPGGVYQPLDTQLTDIAAATPTDNGVLIGNGTTFVVESGATLKTSLGLTIGTDVQAWDVLLDDIAALSDPGADRFLIWDDSAGELVWAAPATGLAFTATPTIGFDLNSLTEDTAPDQTADFVVIYDASGGDHNKVLLNKIGIGKKAMWIPASSMIPNDTDGPSVGQFETSTNDVMVRTLDFSASTAQSAQFSFGAPDSFGTTTFTFKPYWSHPSTTTNFGVVWELSALAVSNDDALDTAFGTAVEVADTGGTTDDQYIGDESSAVTASNTFAQGDMLYFKIARDPANGSDNLAVNARLHGVMVFATTTKNTEN